MGLLETIKKAGMEAVGSTNPVGIMFGTVNSTSPLEITVDQRFIITGEFLIIPESLMQYLIDLEGVMTFVEPLPPDPPEKTYIYYATGNDLIVKRKPLANGDKLILLRVQGGQKYLVLDRVWEG